MRLGCCKVSEGLRRTQRRVLHSGAALLAGAWLFSVPLAGHTQSAELLQTYQQFETARAAQDWPNAVAQGRKALQLADAATISAAELKDLLCRLGEALANNGDSKEALLIYQRALAAQETALGLDHPDLAPTLQALAELQIKTQHYAEAEELLRRMLAIEEVAYGKRNENLAGTLGRLRDLYKTVGRNEDAERIETRIDMLSASVRSPIARASRSERRYKQDEGSATVRVFYGTNRAPSGSAKPAQFYTAERGELAFGYVDVSIPEMHREGELETQSRWSLLTYVLGENSLKRRYVMLDKVTPLDKKNFVGSLREHIGASPSKDVFIFVHGFNNTFEDAARRSAQLAYDLDFNGTPMMYSWPSQGSTTAYTFDEAAVAVSSRRLAKFMETVVAESGARRIHLIAHSMGNRALIEGLETYLETRAPAERKKIFGQVVLTAPDVDRDYFLETVASLEAAADRVTLYASNNDLALKTSETIHGAPRAGLAGAGIISLPWLDTIDMSGIEADMLGHTYFAADAGAIYDLFRLLWRDDPPPRRCGMSNRTQTGMPVWNFNVSVCKGQDLLKAGVLFKRFGQRARARVEARIASLKDPGQIEEWKRILARLDDVLKTPGQE